MSTTRWIAAFAVLLLVLASPAPAQVKFTSFTSEHGRFTVLMPEAPKQDNQVITNPALSAPIKIYSFHATEGDLLFLVLYGDYPADYVSDVDDELEAAQVNFNLGVDAELVAAKRTDFRRGPDDLLPALQFSSASAAYNFEAIVIWEGTRVYQIVASSPKGVDATRDVERFLSSFVLKRP